MGNYDAFRMIKSCTLLLLLLSSSAGAQTAPDNISPRDYEIQIIEAERNGDISVFEKLLADNCVTIGPDGKRHGKAEVLKILRSIQKQSITATDFIVLPAGRDAAIVNYVVTVATPDGSTRQHTASSVWLRTKGGWQMVFHQGTEIPKVSSIQRGAASTNRWTPAAIACFS